MSFIQKKSYSFTIRVLREVLDRLMAFHVLLNSNRRMLKRAQAPYDALNCSIQAMDELCLVQRRYPAFEPSGEWLFPQQVFATRYATLPCAPYEP